jgi:hypothetical protein
MANLSDDQQALMNSVLDGVEGPMPQRRIDRAHNLLAQGLERDELVAALREDTRSFERAKRRRARLVRKRRW